MSSSDQNNSRESPPATSNRRRSSFVDMFNPRASMNGQNQGPRRLSITTLGLSAMPGAQSSPFNSMRGRTESVSSANSGSVDESPFEEDPASPNPNTSASVPATPFSRRMSLGAARTLGRGPTSAGGGGGQNGGNNGNGRVPGSSPSSVAFERKASASSPSGAAKSREGFDFAENLRARAERTSSISAGMFGGMGPQSPPMSHHRSRSIAMEPPKNEMPKQAARPDAFQERILKGDFYMD
ncbi:hypothetical protein BT63DRAFT_412400 [Microthyrium microscopicum]|uniref:Uncharacterized protein n=1 Tax=Microthyrium microscopicum TaxID=703497 RepID=A0A6A6UJW3_9PEZI|nr:hypothetical protein BT63DRAFT_412400 [Microthyrium microscopicum]